MRLEIKEGLNIPLAGGPIGPLQSPPKFNQIALTLNSFEETRFKLLAKPKDAVKVGQPLLESKSYPGLFFVSPAAGTLSEIRRGLKRRFVALVITLDETETFFNEESLGLSSASQEQVIEHLLKKGIFPHIRMRPFDLPADPNKRPRDIFVRALETAPYTPSAESQIENDEEDFQVGLDALKKLTTGTVHLVYKEGTTCKAFIDAKGVEKHSIHGPHPAGNASVHIHLIKPIRHAEDVVWTLSALDVLVLGKSISKGNYHVKRVISIAGDGILEGKQGFFKGRMGVPIESLIVGRTLPPPLRLISGDPLMGSKVDPQDFLEFSHTVFTAIPEEIGRQFLHFLRLGDDKYSAHRAYLSGLLPTKKDFRFTTNLHGEPRPFIDGGVYRKVMPMPIPVQQLIRSLLAEDFELAETLGLLEVASEDFALPAFICPSKIEMVDIVKQALVRYSKEMGY